MTIDKGSGTQDNDPAQAFDALRRTVEDQSKHLNAEITVIRKGLEAAFEQFDTFQQPTDYRADLGKMSVVIEGLGENLQKLGQSPMLRQGPEHYARTLERSGESLLATATQKLEKQGRDLEQAAERVADLAKGARARKSQNLRLWLAGVTGFAVAIAAFLLLPRVLPFEADTRLAAAIVGKDRWSAGIQLMEEAEPKSWDALRADWQLTRDNADAILKCRQDAQQAGKAQSCTIMVPPTL